MASGGAGHARRFVSGFAHLTGEERRTKLYALEAHASQFEHKEGAPILSPELLRPAERQFEVYLVS